MSKLPIPDDWNGDDWKCVQIDWPDSSRWFAILNGLMSQAARGRLWDERTGTITDVQEVGREIWYRNTPFRSCEDEPEDGDNDTRDITPGFESIEIEPEYFVACHLYDPQYKDLAEDSIKKVEETKQFKNLN